MATLPKAVIQKRIRQHTLPPLPLPLGLRERLRPAAVLVPLLEKKGEWHLLLTRRTQHVGNHKGQVAFPGGAMEPKDPSPEATALRETFEEIGIPPETIDVIGRLPEQPVISGFLVTPVVAFLPTYVRWRPSREEIARVFTVPLAWLGNPDHLSLSTVHTWEGVKYPVHYYQPYEGEVIWGLTARIIQSLIKALTPPGPPLSSII